MVRKEDIRKWAESVGMPIVILGTISMLIVAGLGYMLANMLRIEITFFKYFGTILMIIGIIGLLLIAGIFTIHILHKKEMV